MKKLLSLALTVVFVVCLCCCNEKKDEQVESDQSAVFPDIESMVAAGTVFSNESEVKIGDSFKTFSTKYKLEDTQIFSISKGNLKLYNTDNSLRVCFDAESKYEKVKAVAALCDVYGLTLGVTTSDEIGKYLGVTETYTPQKDEMFFFYSVPENVTAIKYISGSNMLRLYFSDGNFCGAFLSAADFSYNVDYNVSEE